MSTTKWQEYREKYGRTVDLSTFSNADAYPGYFEETITPGTTIEFENRFREVVQSNASDGYLVAAEVVYWKNYGLSKSKAVLTSDLIDYLQAPNRWEDFCRILKLLAGNPTITKFEFFLGACDMNKGFATPVTFLSFLDPDRYPMVDKHIANWWRAYAKRFNGKKLAVFDQRADGWINCVSDEKRKKNWKAYLAWSDFCCKTAGKLNQQTGTDWTARDVGVAVWEKCNPETDSSK